MLTPCQTIWIEIIQHSHSPHRPRLNCVKCDFPLKLVILFNLLWIASAFPALVWGHWGGNRPERWEDMFRFHLGREARVGINMWWKGNERRWLCLVSNGSWRDCNQRLIPIHHTNSTLSGAIWKGDILHTFMQMWNWLVLDCFFGSKYFGFMLLDGWRTCKEVAGLS